MHFEFKSTFKMNNPSFTFVAAKSLLIWLYTNLIAAVSYCIFMLASGGLEPLSSIISFTTFAAIIMLGLVFSFPANLVVVPALYLLDMLRSKWYRLAYSIVIVFLSSLLVIVCFFRYFDVPNAEWPEIITFLLPYIIGAEISFIVVGRKLIFGLATEMPRVSTHHPEKI